MTIKSCVAIDIQVINNIGFINMHVVQWKQNEGQIQQQYGETPTEYIKNKQP